MLALSFSVTYWDRLGWKDTFGRPDYTDRQKRYEPSLGHSGPFTPQIVVNGRRDTVGNDLSAVEQLIAAAVTDKGPPVSIDKGRLTVGAGDGAAAVADIWLVRYDPRTVTVSLQRGENIGRALPHTNVVSDLARVGSWTGAPVSLDLPAAPPGLQTAVLVQTRGGGPILGAATD